MHYCTLIGGGREQKQMRQLKLVCLTRLPMRVQGTTLTFGNRAFLFIYFLTKWVGKC